MRGVAGILWEKDGHIFSVEVCFQPAVQDHDGEVEVLQRMVVFFLADLHCPLDARVEGFQEVFKFRQILVGIN